MGGEVVEESTLDAEVDTAEEIIELDMIEDDTDGDVEGPSEESIPVDDGYTISGKVVETAVDDTTLLEIVELAGDDAGCGDGIGVADEDVVRKLLEAVTVSDVGVE